MLTDFNKTVTDYMADHNPFFSGGDADLLSVLPFLVLCALLYLAGREMILAGKAKKI